MHWDPTYHTNSKALSCNPNTPGTQFGMYGDYHCDPPLLLLDSAVKAMYNIKSDVDFLIWTGDDTPHIWNDTILNKDVVSAIIGNQSTILRQMFENKTVYPALGNHDWSPKNQVPPRSDQLYDTIAEFWKYWLDDEALVTFKQAAYYTMMISNKLRMVVLNTNLYYDSNKLTEAMPDPGNQLQWFDDLLNTATLHNEKVIVVAHVPPGVFEKHRNKHWFYPYYNDLFLFLLKKHSAIIGSVHMAHHHTDSFRVHYEDDGTPVTSLFLAPSVTPWETTLPDVMGGLGNNPGIRLIQYDRDSGRVLDIHQYYLNLTKANLDSTDQWLLEYNATSYFGVPDMSPSSLHDLAEKMKDDDQLFSKYYKANGVLYDPDERWVEEMRIVHYCAAVNMAYDRYDECIRSMEAVSGAVQDISRLKVFPILVTYWLVSLLMD
ncbi:hypothetical protein LSH36_196g05044 [Paralvinella palmiformis]|uniref:Acid sphingomyelinase-like phosphodiesterase 3b n=1 Tax=Paralvinella palmiformis TaxID=53620 RepID=A0AAD9JQP6_9ANNE|nr:hypothetical protein LSH36_196g05044 [Paralvinella palmiformis]